MFSLVTVLLSSIITFTILNVGHDACWKHFIRSKHFQKSEGWQGYFFFLVYHAFTKYVCQPRKREEESKTFRWTENEREKERSIEKNFFCPANACFRWRFSQQQKCSWSRVDSLSGTTSRSEQSEVFKSLISSRSWQISNCDRFWPNHLYLAVAMFKSVAYPHRLLGTVSRQADTGYLPSPSSQRPLF